MSSLDISQYSFSRDGLMKITFSSNVRDLAADVRRKQLNQAIQTNLDLGIRPSQSRVSDIGEPYSVFNSDIHFDRNDELSIDDMLQTLTVKEFLIPMLQGFRIPFSKSARKGEIVQLLKNAIQGNSQRIQLLREYYSRYLLKLRGNKQRGQRNVNTTLLVSNHYKYKRSDFDGMSLKEILQSLFNQDQYMIFLYKRVLREKEIPNGRLIAIMKAREATKNFTDAQKETYYKAESSKSDAILKANSRLVLEFLFSSKQPFYIDNNRYTILSYQQENGSSQMSQNEILMNMQGVGKMYAVYPVKVYLVLSDKPSQEIVSKDIQAASCHLSAENIRKNWHDIWWQDIQKKPEIGYERKHYNELQRRSVSGGSFRATRKYKLRNLKKSRKIKRKT